jgi:hypothetical protein
MSGMLSCVRSGVVLPAKGGARRPGEPRWLNGLNGTPGLHRRSFSEGVRSCPTFATCPGLAGTQVKALSYSFFAIRCL